MGDETTKINPWEMVQAQIDKAVRHIDCDPNMIEKLRYPERSLLVSVPVRMDDGGSGYSRDTGCSTAPCADRPREGSATTRAWPWMR